MRELKLGDMDSDSFRRAGRSLLEWTPDYLRNGDRYPVLARVQPGWIRASLPAAAPERGESFDAILRDFERVLVPGLTHWNQPGFLAYFASSGSAPGVLAEFLTAALNQQAMLWQTSPAATELEEVVLAWLRQLLGLPDAFEGVAYDGGSASNLHALAAAVPLSVVCFRAVPRGAGLDADAIEKLNSNLLTRVNASGGVLLSGTRLNGRHALRLAVGHIRTSEAHVGRAWQIVRESLRGLLPPRTCS